MTHKLEKLYRRVLKLKTQAEKEGDVDTSDGLEIVSRDIARLYAIQDI